MILSGNQYELLTEALLSAFPSRQKLRQMVRFRLNENLNAVAGGENLTAVTFNLIEWAESGGQLPKLVVGALASQPGNEKLLRFAEKFGLATQSLPEKALERVIDENDGFLDVHQWRTSMGEMESRVCRVEIPLNNGKYATCGTGFLVGPDVVITNYHVMEPVIEYERQQTQSTGLWALPNDVILRFDYKRLEDGRTVNLGTEYRLAPSEDWLIHCSPLSPVDSIPEPKSSVPERDHLDYALLRVDGTPGLDPIGQSAEPDAPSRGWVEPSSEPYDFVPDTPLLILQHPRGQPLKLVLKTDAIIGVNANRTRVMYRTNTMRGSSGSPCFNINWELVALHHLGDPDFTPTHSPEYNQGIPFDVILELLEQHGLAGALGAG
jgi:hypothetical protein